MFGEPTTSGPLPPPSDAGPAGGPPAWAGAEVRTLDPAPEQTIETLKEDAQWLSERRS